MATLQREEEDEQSFTSHLPLPGVTSASSLGYDSAQRNLPPPPRFPSMTDVTPSPTNEPEEVSDVAWLRPAAETSPPSASVASLVEGDEVLSEGAEQEQPAQGMVAKIVAKLKAMFKKKEAPKMDTKQSNTKPALVKAKEMICKLPDPTLLFVLEASIMLTLHIVRPAILRTWVARTVFPFLLVSTVAATALWRPTKMVSLKAVPEYYSRAKPIPNAGKVVSIGESLRAREAKLVKKEDELRAGQMRLEVLRKEIEGRLPPQVSIANLLDRENEAARANAR